MRVYKVLALPIVIGALAISSGCSAKSSSGETAPSLTLDHTSKSHHGHQYLKPGASISYEHDMPADITPGQTLNFQLTLNEAYESGSMSVDIRGEGDINIYPSSTSASFDMSEGTEHVMDISVTVGAEGRHYIHVQALANTGSGQAMPRIFSIPVQSGNPKALKPNVNLKTTASGKKMIIMEAQEVIK